MKYKTPTTYMLVVQLWIRHWAQNIEQEMSDICKLCCCFTQWRNELVFTYSISCVYALLSKDNAWEAQKVIVHVRVENILWSLWPLFNTVLCTILVTYWSIYTLKMCVQRRVWLGKRLALVVYNNNLGASQSPRERSLHRMTWSKMRVNYTSRSSNDHSKYWI